MIRCMKPKLRFEIFKRDKFVCQYCGGKPPESVLVVDHVHPVSKGGSDEQENLITSCERCNQGKGDKPVASELSPLVKTMEIEKERFDQLREYESFLSQKSEQMQKWVSVISDEWIRLDGEDPSKYQISEKQERAVRRFLKLLPATEIIDALRITFDRLENASPHVQFKYFCAVCWRKSRGEGPTYTCKS